MYFVWHFIVISNFISIFPIFPGINVIFLFYIRRNIDELDFDSEQILI